MAGPAIVSGLHNPEGPRGCARLDPAGPFRSHDVEHDQVAALMAASPFLHTLSPLLWSGGLVAFSEWPDMPLSWIQPGTVDPE